MYPLSAEDISAIGAANDTQTMIIAPPPEEGQPAVPFDDTPTPALAPDSEVTLELPVCLGQGG